MSRIPSVGFRKEMSGRFSGVTDDFETVDSRTTKKRSDKKCVGTASAAAAAAAPTEYE